MECFLYRLTQSSHAGRFEFDGSGLAEAIRLTLENRGTEIPDVISAFTDEFVMVKGKQWTAFCKRLGQEHVPAGFAEVVVGVEGFLQPIASVLSAGEQFSRRWSVSGHWVCVQEV